MMRLVATPPAGWYTDVLDSLGVLENLVTLVGAVLVFLLAVLVVSSWGR